MGDNTSRCSRVACCQVMADVYRIRVKGQLAPSWAEWFDGLSIADAENGEAVLSGPIADQTALHRLLIKIRDLGLPLIEVTRVAGDGPPRSLAS